MIGYHATTMENAFKISADGAIKKGIDKVVYFCKDPNDACKFLAIRGIKEMVVFQFEVPDNQVEESFDHCESFFGCKAYYAKCNITDILDAKICHIGFNLEAKL